VKTLLPSICGVTRDVLLYIVVDFIEPLKINRFSGRHGTQPTSGSPG